MKNTSGLLLAGDVYWDRLEDNGEYAGIVHLFDAKKFAITEPSTAKTRESRSSDSYGQAKATVYVKGTPQIAAEGDDINANVLALALFGSVGTLTQASGTVTEATPALKKDFFIQLPHTNIAEAGTVITNAAGSTTYVEGTDYVINRRMGWIMALTNAAATAGNKLNYAYGAVSGSVITGGARPVVRGRLILDGRNLETQQQVVVTIDEARLAPAGEIDFASADFVKASLAGQLRTLPGKTGPYTIALKSLA